LYCNVSVASVHEGDRRTGWRVFLCGIPLSPKRDTLSRPPRILVVGKPSGDMLAARLMAGLKELTGGSVDFAGGEVMREEGLASPFPRADLAAMGYAEVAPRIPRLFQRQAQTVADIEARRQLCWAVRACGSAGPTDEAHPVHANQTGPLASSMP
jgi:Lipid-A-disaccharide synthetase